MAELESSEVLRSSTEEETAFTLMEKCYGLKTKFVEKLNGYDDKNFFIEVDGTSAKPHMSHVSNAKYILKVLNWKDSKDHNIVEGQNLLMQFLSQSDLGISVPTPLKNLEGNYYSLEILESSEDNCSLEESNVQKKFDGKKHVVRLFEFLPGKLMKKVGYDKDLLFQVGKLSGKLYTLFKNFSNEALEKRKIIWQLGTVPELYKFLYVIKEENKLNILEEVLFSWKSNVETVIPFLEKGLIHGDINEQNILIASDNQNRNHICGILDYGDVNYSPVIFELAISMAYAILEVDNMDFSESGGYVIAGYATERNITEAEWNILKECVAARLAQSLILGAYTHLLDPRNDYLLCTAKKGWKVLRNFWSVPKNELLEHWKTNSMRSANK